MFVKSLIVACLSITAGVAAVTQDAKCLNAFGSCQDVGTACSGSYKTGFCPSSGNSIKCCVVKQDAKCATAKGKCQSTSKSCSGSFKTGLCPSSGASIKCCAPKSSTPPPPPSSGGVAGLNAKQTAHAKKIAAAAHSTGVGLRGCWVGFVTAITESNIKVYANKNIAESYKYPHDAVGSDHRSVGIFQQQVPGWGTVKDCMDPTSSAKKFFNALKRIKNWQSMSVGKAAQKVQVSAFPDRYQTHLAEAQRICKALY
ncbi:hypothetical protein HK104_007355 [Borealophlyctis nickersoniae]|nr:hypothetical protein HK104_007355 [Borealophlyctis nickersoniae]